MNWITPRLQQEIDNCSPPAELSSDSNDDNEDDANIITSDSFKEAFHKLFPEKRIFASHIQLGQVATKLADLWSFRIANAGMTIQCHFGAPTYKGRGKNIRNRISMKELIKCPFRINYTSMTKDRRNKLLPKVYYRVRISSTNATHTCCLNNTVSSYQ